MKTSKPSRDNGQVHVNIGAIIMYMQHYLLWCNIQLSYLILTETGSCCHYNTSHMERVHYKEEVKQSRQGFLQIPEKFQVKC